jgi:uncharacterized RDD family membrane protein YckC
MGGGYGVNGALAEQLRPSPRMRLVERVPDLSEREQPNLSQAIQGTLFQSSNVISMPPRLEPKPRVRSDAPTKPATNRTATRRARPVPEGQGTLDFLPPAPAKPRQLGTSVEAVIYCEAPVASTLHRAVACALDWSMVLVAYVLFLGAFSALGGQFELTRANLMLFAGMFGLIGFTYGFFFAWVGSETPGMLWAQLKLTTFDGFPPDRRQRMVRFIASSLSRTTLLGLLWSLADEESLAWHDHISRTFPTLRDSRTLVFRDER